ncbi:response regulator [Bremerella alba]|uniref:Transcriptional regulatory protein TcrA n=1 Tax=Bremerella alba TaxID=980252 RepID=A0A7V8V5B8_9BACT|nr:response regulator [Bremerella alba]MBA2115210.1 Transcriptional regulatory protein TcrA [Bremerella alba]
MDCPSLSKSAPRLKCLPSLQTLHILATEDQPFHQELLKRALSRHGATFHIEPDGESTLARADLSSFDVIFLDLMLPDTDGLQLALALRDRNVQTPMVAVTAGTMTYTPKVCYEAGFQGFLEKPYSPIGLAAMIRSVCELPTNI